MSTYTIIEDRQPVDGEFLTEEQLFAKLPYVKPGRKILEFDLTEAINGSSAMRNVTEDMVLAALRKGAFDGFENARDMIAGEFIHFPISRAQMRANAADHHRHLVAEGAI